MPDGSARGSTVPKLHIVGSGRPAPLTGVDKAVQRDEGVGQVASGSTDGGVWQNQAVAGLSSDEVAALEAAAAAYVAAMRAEDWTGVAGSFTDDAVRIPPHEEPHRGRAAIEGWLRGIEQLVSYDLTRDALDGADGLAYVRGRYAITLRPVGAPEPISDSGDFLEIWRREPDGAWRIAEAIWNTRVPLGD